MAFTMPETGVLKIPGWSIKAWWSANQQTYFVQIERYDETIAGWVRGWLVSPESSTPQTFRTLEAAQQAACEFAEAPDVCWWQENVGIA
jgi:hypothetical protein